MSSLEIFWRLDGPVLAAVSAFCVLREERRGAAFERELQDKMSVNNYGGNLDDKPTHLLPDFVDCFEAVDAELRAEGLQRGISPRYSNRRHRRKVCHETKSTWLCRDKVNDTTGEEDAVNPRFEGAAVEGGETHWVLSTRSLLLASRSSAACQTRQCAGCSRVEARTLRFLTADDTRVEGL